MTLSNPDLTPPEHKFVYFPRVVVSMMERDEEIRLEAWILYHANLFGFENLYIYDNGSTSKLVEEILTKYAELGVHVDYSRTGSEAFAAKGDILAKKFIALDADPRNLFFIPLDRNELLTLRLPDGSLSADRSAILGYLETLIHDPHILVAQDAYANVFDQPGHFLPAYAHHKVFFTEGCCTWMDECFQCRHMVRQSTCKLAHLVDVTDSDKVRDFQGSGSHVAWYLSMKETEHLSGFFLREGIHLPWLVPFLENLSIGGPIFQSI